MKEYLKMSDVFRAGVLVENSIAYTLKSELGRWYRVREVNDDTMMCSSDHVATYAAHAINSHDELVEMNKELLSELKAMAKAYINLMESGKDRIESLGGDCDEVAYMAAHDANLVHACSVIGKYYGGAA